MLIVLLMVFSFTLFTYNGQRLFRLRQKLLQPDSIGERLKWIIKHKTLLTFFTVLFGCIGLICSYFINPYCFIILIPMGGFSIFYVVPIIPFYKNSPSLRDLPYLKIFIIGLVWSIAIVWLPLIDTKFGIGLDINLFISLLQNFLFVIAITLPFDIRDVKFDESNNLKTIPQLIGIKQTTALSILLLLISIFLLEVLPIKIHHYYALMIGYMITIIIIAFTTEKRKELFFAGLVEGTVLILYCCVTITDHLYSL